MPLDSRPLHNTKNEIPVTSMYDTFLKCIVLAAFYGISLCSQKSWYGEMAVTKSREKFVELAQKRVVRAIKDIRLIGNLSNKNNYAYDEEDVTKIISALEREIRDLKGRFKHTGQADEIIFHL